MGDTRCGTRMVRRKSRGVVHRRARTRRYAGNASILRSTRHAGGSGSARHRFACRDVIVAGAGRVIGTDGRDVPGLFQHGQSRACDPSSSPFLPRPPRPLSLPSALPSPPPPCRPLPPHHHHPPTHHPPPPSPYPPPPFTTFSPPSSLHPLSPFPPPSSTTPPPPSHPLLAHRLP